MCIFLIFKILIYFCSCYDEMINEKNDPFFRFPFFSLKTDMEWTEDTLIVYVAFIRFFI